MIEKKISIHGRKEIALYSVHKHKPVQALVIRTFFNRYRNSRMKQRSRTARERRKKDQATAKPKEDSEYSTKVNKISLDISLLADINNFLQINKKDKTWLKYVEFNVSVLSETCFRIRRRLPSQKSKAMSRRVALAAVPHRAQGRPAELRARSSPHQVPHPVQSSLAKQRGRLSCSPQRCLLSKGCRQTHRVIPTPTRTSWTCLHCPFQEHAPPIMSKIMTCTWD